MMRAEYTITKLNLNDKRLCRARENALWTFNVFQLNGEEKQRELKNLNIQKNCHLIGTQLNIFDTGRLIYVKYDRNLVATIIENEFWDDLYNEIDDSVMNMEGQELDEAFETYVDYAELDQIENVKVVRVEQEEDDTCTIVR